MWASKFAFDIMDFPVVAGVVVFRFCLESVCGAGVCFQGYFSPLLGGEFSVFNGVAHNPPFWKQREVSNETTWSLHLEFTVKTLSSVEISSWIYPVVCGCSFFCCFFRDLWSPRNVTII